MRRCLPPAPRLKPSIRGSAVVVAAVLGLVLAGCQVPFPSPQRGRIPSPFPGIPGGGATIPSPLPSPSSSPIPSLPSPSLPSPSSPSLPSPSSPSLPSPSLPSPSSPPTGNPSPFPLPGSQSSGSGDGGSPSAWPPSGGGPQQGGGQGGLEPPTGAKTVGKPEALTPAGRSATRPARSPDQMHGPAKRQVPKQTAKRTATARSMHWNAPSENSMAKSWMSGSPPPGANANPAGAAVIPRGTSFQRRPTPSQAFRSRRYRLRQTNPMPGTMTWLRVKSARPPWRKPTQNCASSFGKSIGATSPDCETR